MLLLREVALTMRATTEKMAMGMIVIRVMGLRSDRLTVPTGRARVVGEQVAHHPEEEGFPADLPGDHPAGVVVHPVEGHPEVAAPGLEVREMTRLDCAS